MLFFSTCCYLRRVLKQLQSISVSCLIRGTDLCRATDEILFVYCVVYTCSDNTWENGAFWSWMFTHNDINFRCKLIREYTYSDIRLPNYKLFLPFSASDLFIASSLKCLRVMCSLDGFFHHVYSNDNIITRICDYKRCFDWRLDLLTAYRVVTITLSVISTLYKSPQHTLSLFNLLSSPVVPR
jgi:hypothetical protein